MASDTAEPRIALAHPPAEGIVVLDLAGELDLAVSSQLRALVDEATGGRPQLVVADLTEVAFMDSTVLREMLRAHREISGQGGRFVVAGAQPTVRRLFELTGTAEMFLLVDRREDALTP